MKEPFVRIVEYSCPEYKKLIRNLERVTVENSRLHFEIRNTIKDNPFLLIYQYVPCLTLNEFGPSRCKRIFSEKNFKSREIFIELGKTIAFDCFINNWNRVPFVWPLRGNDRNVAFAVNIDMLPPFTYYKDTNYLDIYIESTLPLESLPNCFDPADPAKLKYLGDYLNKLNDKFKQFFYEMKSVLIYGVSLENFEFRSLAEVTSMFYNNCELNVSSKNLLHVALGILVMIDVVVEIKINKIADLIEQFRGNLVSRDWANVFSDGVDELNKNYFQYMINYFKQLKIENDEVFDWVRDVCFGFYSENSEVGFSAEWERLLGTKYVKEEQVENEEDQPEVDQKKEEQVVQEKPNKIDDLLRNGQYDVLELDDGLVMGSNKRGNRLIRIQPVQRGCRQSAI